MRHGATDGGSDGVRVDLPGLIRLRAAARGLELGARRLALSAQAGGYLSAYRGRGVELDEVRAYQSGDDARSIDWRVTARRGRLHTKLFREERDRPVLLLVDLSPSMFFGTRRCLKSVLAARAAALVAWAAERAGARVGGVVAAADGHRELPPRTRRGGVLSLLHAVVAAQPSAPGVPLPGRLDGALLRLARVTHPGSLVLLLSDFGELGDDGERHLAALVRHNDIIAGLIYDPLEAEPPPPGRYLLGTPGRRLAADTARGAVAKAWREGFAAHRERLAAMCLRHGAHFATLSTDQDPLAALRRALVRHGGGGGRGRAA